MDGDRQNDADIPIILAAWFGPKNPKRPGIVVHTTAASRVLLGPRTHSAELGVIDATVRTKSSHPIANALSEGAWRYTTRARPEVSFGR